MQNSSSDSGCARQIFVEPLGGLSARYARTTASLAQAHLAIGLALGGEAGARLAEKTAMSTSPGPVYVAIAHCTNAKVPPPTRIAGQTSSMARKPA